MTQPIETDMAVIGAGSAGLGVAAGAVRLGASVVLVEQRRMGGDCLNFGCVPSKSLLAAAAAAQAIRGGATFGVDGHEPAVDFPAVQAHVEGVIAAIAPHDSAQRFRSLGVRVIQGTARFTGSRDLVAGEWRVRARRIVVATGSRPAVPPIPGLEEVPYLTNETVFALTDRPRHLLVLGGGPVGVELAQAHRRLGAAVTLLERATILPKDDPEAVAVVRARLLAEGVDVREGAAVVRVEAAGNGLAVTLDGPGGEERLTGSHLLVAAGRRPNVEELGLEAADISCGPKGIVVDPGLRTTNRRAYAIGDVTGDLAFTHMAAHHASVVIRNALFRLPAKVDRRAVPWVTYCDPELAQVGPTEAEARARGLAVGTVRSSFAENDRARTERASEGFLKLVVDRRGRPIGATIVGRHAGELVHLWVLAIQERIPLRRIASMIAPYPTLGEAGKRAAGAWFEPALFGPRTRRFVRLLQRLG
jgi:pyruvate/2-oxoglutarate dehydrogenase complex dihydrolipoamide dehydrogenase (E3) component